MAWLLGPLVHVTPCRHDDMALQCNSRPTCCQPGYPNLSDLALCVIGCPYRFVDDPELAYIVERARQVHDFWHVLFNCHTNAFGEVALKAVEFVQARLSRWLVSVGPLPHDLRGGKLALNAVEVVHARSWGVQLGVAICVGWRLACPAGLVFLHSSLHTARGPSPLSVTPALLPAS